MSDQQLGQIGDPDSPYLLAPEAVRYLRYPSIRALYKALVPQQIPHLYRGNRVLLFDKAALDRWLAGERPEPKNVGRPPMKLASTR
jgi:hypothetical protein